MRPFIHQARIISNDNTLATGKIHMTEEILKKAYSLLDIIKTLKNTLETSEALLSEIEKDTSGNYSVATSLIYPCKRETKIEILKLMINDLKERLRDPLKEFKEL